MKLEAQFALWRNPGVGHQEAMGAWAGDVNEGRPAMTLPFRQPVETWVSVRRCAGITEPVVAMTEKHPSHWAPVLDGFPQQQCMNSNTFSLFICILRDLNSKHSLKLLAC